MWSLCPQFEIHILKNITYNGNFKRMAGNKIIAHQSNIKYNTYIDFLIPKYLKLQIG